MTWVFEKQLMTNRGSAVRGIIGHLLIVCLVRFAARCAAYKECRKITARRRRYSALGDLVERLAKYRDSARHALTDFDGSRHESYDGDWEAATWVVSTGGVKSFYAVTAREIGVSFEFHRIEEAD